MRRGDVALAERAVVEQGEKSVGREAVRVATHLHRGHDGLKTVEGGLDAISGLQDRVFGGPWRGRGILAGAAGLGGGLAIIEEFREIARFVEMISELVRHPDRTIPAVASFFSEGDVSRGLPPVHGRTAPKIVQVPPALPPSPGPSPRPVPPSTGVDRDAPLGGSPPSPLARLLPALDSSVALHLAGQGRDAVFAPRFDTPVHSIDEAYTRTVRQASADGVAVTAGSVLSVEVRSPTGALSHSNVEVVDRDRYRVLVGDDGQSTFSKPRGFEDPRFVSISAAQQQRAAERGDPGVVDARTGTPGPGGVVARLTAIQVGSQVDERTFLAINSAGRFLGRGDGVSIARVETGLFRVGAATDTSATFVSDGIEGGLRSLKLDRPGPDGGNRVVLSEGLPGGSSSMEASVGLPGGLTRRSLVMGLSRDDLSVGPGGVAKVSPAAALALETAGQVAGRASEVEKATEALGPGRRSTAIFDRTSGRTMYLVEGADRAVGISDDGLFLFAKDPEGRWHVGKSIGEGVSVDRMTGRERLSGKALDDIKAFSSSGNVSVAARGQPSLSDGVPFARSLVETARAASDRSSRPVVGDIASARGIE